MAEIDPEVRKHYYGEVRGDRFEADAADSTFCLGPVKARYEIAEFGFVEYAETNFHNGPEYGDLTGKHRFAIYINGFSIGQSVESLDAALIHAVSYKRDGVNTQAGRLFMKATTPRVG